MNASKQLSSFTNLLAAVVVFAFGFYSLQVATSLSPVLFGLVAVFAVGQALYHLRQPFLSKLVFIITCNIALFVFDSGIAEGTSHLLYIPVVISYFILFNLKKEWKYITASIVFTIVMVVLSNSTEFSPGYAQYLPIGPYTHFLLSLGLTLIEALVLINANFIFDNTLNKRGEETNQLHAQLRAVFDSGIQYLVLLDTDFKVLLADKKTVQLVKKIYNKDLVEGMDFRTVLEMGSLGGNGYKERFEKALKGEPAEVETHIKVEGNREVWLEVRYTPISSKPGTVDFVIFGAQNITAGKLVRQKIEENEKLLNSLNENIQEGLYRSTPQKGFLYVNTAFVKRFFICEYSFCENDGI
jgi:PAS domain-containing protein